MWSKKYLYHTDKEVSDLFLFVCLCLLCVCVCVCVRVCGYVQEYKYRDIWFYSFTGSEKEFYKLSKVIQKYMNKYITI
jgi:hypothetical protein